MKKLWILPALLLGTFAQAACDNDDDIRVSPEFESAFQMLYPQVNRVSWEREGNYFVADFWRNDMNAEAEAWFDASAQWRMTVTEISRNSLPQPVQQAFESGTYGSWRVEDVDMVEREGMETLYIFEVEQGNREYDLYYTADGTLVREVLDTDGNNNPSHYLPAEISSAIQAYVTANYPNARIIDIEREANRVEVEILDGGKRRELHFTVAGGWQLTMTEVSQAQVPADIMQAFNQSGYSGSRIDDIDWCQTPESEFYLFELDTEPEDTYIKIYPNGTIEAGRAY